MKQESKTTVKSLDLKLCPLCGQPAHIECRHPKIPFNAKSNPYTVGCLNEKCLLGAWPHAMDFPTMLKAAKAWNRRANV